MNSPHRHHLEGYAIVKEIGLGSFSTVYLAESKDPETLPRQVAIKAIPLGRLNRKLLENLQQEIEALRNLGRHSNIGTRQMD